MKKKKIIIFTIIFIILIISIVILLFSLTNNKLEKVVQKKTTNTITTTKQVIINSEELIQNLYEPFNVFNHNLECNIDSQICTIGYFFNNNILTKEDVPNEIMGYLAVNNLCKKEDCLKKFSLNNSNIIYKASDIRKEINNIFGPNTSFTDENILYSGDTVFIYQQTSDNYTMVMSGIGSEEIYEIKRQIIDTKVDSKKVEITEKVALFQQESSSEGYYNEWAGYYIIKLYTGGQLNKKQIAILKGNSTTDISNEFKVEDFNILDYSDELYTYKWTFIKASDGNYYFDSVRKI